MSRAVVAIDDVFDFLGIYCPPPHRPLVGRQVKITDMSADGMVVFTCSKGPDEPFTGFYTVPYERVRLLIKDGIWVRV